LSQRTSIRIERLFERDKLDTPPIVTNIYLDSSPSGSRPAKKQQRFKA
jgi:hypothetical protein